MTARNKRTRQSVDDIADQEILAACVRVGIGALRPVVQENRDRFLRELKPHEMQNLVVAVLSEYIAQRQLRDIADELNDDISDVGMA